MGSPHGVETAGARYPEHLLRTLGGVEVVLVDRTRVLLELVDRREDSGDLIGARRAFSRDDRELRALLENR